MITDRMRPRNEERMERPIARPLPRIFATFGFTVFNLIVITVLLELVSWAIWSAYHAKHPEGPENQAASPVYQETAWAKGFWQEEHARQKSRHPYVPFLLWGVTDWHGKYVNNDEGKAGVWRRTINPARDECKGRPVAVWTFGGSTVYGTGVPDWATLPSYLSRNLNGDDRTCVVVTNFGDESYISTQELILLIEQLKRGGNPDIVIFYDGFNDAHIGMAALDPRSAHYGLETIEARAEGSFR